MKVEAFYKILRSPVKFRLFLLQKLPLALFAGLRVTAVNRQKCTVSVPYKWMNQNPFRSTYFAALAMAGELSTGALAMAAAQEQRAKVSMLVVKLEAAYFKKAIGSTYFTCNDGVAFSEVIQESVKEGEAKTFRSLSKGVNESGEPVADFYITWSFRVKG